MHAQCVCSSWSQPCSWVWPLRSASLFTHCRMHCPALKVRRLCFMHCRLCLLLGSVVCSLFRESGMGSACCVRRANGTLLYAHATALDTGFISVRACVARTASVAFSNTPAVSCGLTAGHGWVRFLYLKRHCCTETKLKWPWNGVSGSRVHTWVALT